MLLTLPSATRNLGRMDTPGMDARYDEDYFLRGQQSGKSLYVNYRWLPNLTIPMANRITEHCGIQLDETILDFGCARGYLVKALKSLGFDATGYDVSEWALQHCDEEVKDLVSNEWPPQFTPDWVIAKDVLEHVPIHNITRTLQGIANAAKRGVFIVVPLAKATGQGYVVPEYEADVTHALRWPMDLWMEEILNIFDENWEVSCRYRIEGIKDNYAQFARGNGFITCRRL